MSNKVKEILVKAYILLCTASWIGPLYFSYGATVRRSQPDLYSGEEYDFWIRCMLITGTISVVLVLIMIYALPHVDLGPDEVEPIFKRVKASDYVGFKNSIFLNATAHEFGQIVHLAIDDDIETDLAYRDSIDGIYVIQLVKMDNFNLDAVEKATKYFWNETLERYGEEKIKYTAVGLLQCVCVKRINNEFRKYIKQNVEQDFKRYQILSAVSFGGKNAYICKTKESLFGGPYGHLKRVFENLTRDILVSEEEFKLYLEEKSK